MSSDDDLEWTAEDLRFLRRLREQAPNRRDIIKGAAVGAMGMGLGSAATGATMAQPTGDEPAVGEQANPVEVWGSEIDAESVDTDDINTTKYAETISEAQTYIDNASTPISNSDQGGLKIVLPEEELTPDAADLPLTLAPGVHLEGQGPKATKISVPAGYSGRAVEYDNSGGSKSSIRVTIRDLWLSGDSQAGSVGIKIDNGQKWEIDHCRVADFGVNVSVTSGFTGVLEESYLRNAVSDNLVLEDGASAGTNAVRIIGGSLQGAGSDGIFAKNSTGLFIYGTNIEANDGYGIHVTNLDGGQITGYFEGNGGGLDPDSDGNNEAYHIGISPDQSNDAVSRGIDISGSYFAVSDTHSRDVGIKLGNCEEVNIEGNQFQGNTGSSDQHAVEMSEARFNERCSLDRSNNYHDIDQAVVGPLNGLNINPQAINGGRWATDEFGGLSSIDSLTSSSLPATDKEDGITVVIPEKIIQSGTVIQGSRFPYGTKFETRGSRSVLLRSTGSGQPTVDLESYQSIEGFAVEQTADDYAIGVRNDGRVESCRIQEAGGRGLRLFQDRCVAIDVTCVSASIALDDIQVNGENTRVIGCDGNINDAFSTGGAVTAANVDTS